MPRRILFVCTRECQSRDGRKFYPGEVLASVTDSDQQPLGGQWTQRMEDVEDPREGGNLPLATSARG